MSRLEDALEVVNSELAEIVIDGKIDTIQALELEEIRIKLQLYMKRYESAAPAGKLKYVSAEMFSINELIQTGSELTDRRGVKYVFTEIDNTEIVTDALGYRWQSVTGMARVKQ